MTKTVKHLIQTLNKSKISSASDILNSILMNKILPKLEESKKVVVVRGMKKKKMFKRVKGRHVDQKTGRETRISGSEKAKFKKSARIGARKRKATKVASSRKRKLSMMKRR